MPTVSGYFTIDDLTQHLEIMTKDHLGDNAGRYGLSLSYQVQPEANTQFWRPEEFQARAQELLYLPDMGALISELIRKKTFDEFSGKPKTAVTVFGTIGGQIVIETHALDLTRASDMANGIDIPDSVATQKNFSVWNYFDTTYGDPIRRLWTPDRNSKLQVLQERRAYPPVR